MITEQTLCHATQRLEQTAERVGDESHLGLARLLTQRAYSPQSYVTLVGETSSGKSTLANALLGTACLPVAARPTTGTVTHVRCLDRDLERYAIHRDGTRESLDEATFKALSLQPEEGLLRLEVRARPVDPALLGLNLFDTPGYNSACHDHEEALLSFLPQSDAIVYVVSHRGLHEADRDLLRLVAEVTEADPETPVFLVVNRAPRAADVSSRCVAQIQRHAADLLGTPFHMHVTGTSPLDEQGKSIAVPGIERLAEDLRHVVTSEARRARVVEKLGLMTLGLADQIDGLAERQVIELTASVQDQEAIEAMRDELKQAERASLAAVDRCMGRLERMVPRMIERLAADASSQMRELVFTEDRWFGKDECLAYVQSHALPRTVRQAARAVEEGMAIELKKLDDELEEIANTAIRRVESSPRVRSEAVQTFARNLALELGRRMGGQAAASVLRGLGGVGGVAAGAGNLAKMLVARAGALVGKRFGPEVYRAIGRFFSKRMLARLNVAIAVVVEVAGYVADAMTWQKKLASKIDEALEGWRADVTADVLEKDLPSMRRANEQGVRALYEDLAVASRTEEPAGTRERDARLEDLRAVRAELASIRAVLCETDVEERVLNA